MTLSPDQAADSLKAIEETGRRSAQAHEYANASAGFILWGLIWMIGYAGSDLVPTYTHSYRGINWLWFGLTIVGVAGSTFIARRQRRKQRPDQTATGRAIGLRWGATMFTLWIFVIATLAIMRPANPLAIAAFIPMLVAALYAVLGIWRGQRFLIAGIAVAALTLGGFFFLREHFLLWMAAVGGGSLVLVGFWLRSI